jgi:hypothetical protein
MEERSTASGRFSFFVVHLAIGDGHHGHVGDFLGVEDAELHSLHLVNLYVRPEVLRVVLSHLAL